MIEPIVTQSITIYSHPIYMNILPLIIAHIIVIILMGTLLYWVIQESKKPWIFDKIPNASRWNLPEEQNGYQ